MGLRHNAAIHDWGNGMNLAVEYEWLGHVQDYYELAHEYGTPVIIRMRTPDDVSRDRYNTIKMRDLENTGDIHTYALPVDRGPDARMLEKLGMRETCDCAITTPIYDWYPNQDVEEIGKRFAAIDLNRMTVEIDGEQYKVADKGLPVRYGERPVALALALRRN